MCALRTGLTARIVCLAVCLRVCVNRYVESPMPPADPELAARAQWDERNQVWRTREWPSVRPTFVISSLLRCGCATLTLVSLLCGDCSAKREDVERLGEWHRRTAEQIAEFVVDADDQQQALARLSFITFFELFRQVVGHCPPRGEALHRVWLEHRSMMKRLVKDATHDQRKLRRRERKLRRTVRVDVCVCVCGCVCVCVCGCVRELACGAEH